MIKTFSRSYKNNNYVKGNIITDKRGFQQTIFTEMIEKLCKQIKTFKFTFLSYGWTKCCEIGIQGYWSIKSIFNKENKKIKIQKIYDKN